MFDALLRLGGGGGGVRLLRRRLGGPPEVFDAVRVEMFGPRGAEFGGEEIRLVEEEHGSFLRVEFLDERLEVGAPVKHGVPGVDNLDDDVASLAHAPELAPDLEVLLERGEGEALVLLDGGERAAPLEEVSSLVLVEHLGGHVFGPGGASGNLEAVRVERLGGALRLSRGGGARLGDGGGERGAVRALAHAHHHRAATLGGEVAVAQLREREKLVEVVALHDGDEVGTAPPVGLEVGDVAVVALLDVSPVVAADVRAVARGFPRQALDGRKGRTGDGGGSASATGRRRRPRRDQQDEICETRRVGETHRTEAAAADGAPGVTRTSHRARRDAMRCRVGSARASRGADASRKVARREGGGWLQKARTRARSVGGPERPGAGLDFHQPGRWASTATVAEPRARGSSERAPSIASRPSLGARPLRARPRDTPADARARDRRCRGEESLAGAKPPPSVASP